jgi:DNA-binding winged helix-turn-helix (wHTH) protein
MPDDALFLRFDLFELDESEARLARAGAPVPLPPKAFALLCTLARHPGQLVAKEALLDAVWGHRWVSDSVLKTTVSELRAALGDDAQHPRYIETVSRHGYRFMASVAPAQAPATPAPAAALALPPLVGRDDALAQLHAAWQQAQAGQRQMVWLSGEPGMGKTTLITHFIAMLDARAVALGQCVEQHGAGEPYLPLLEALGALARGDAALPALLRDVAPSWLLQMPWLCPQADEREALRRQLAGSGPERMPRELGELLERLTAERPLLLVTEDLHWSDQATLQALDHVARRRGPARLLWLGSFRAAEVVAEEHPLKALRHELRLHGLCREIALEPFSELEVGHYLAGRLRGGCVDEALSRALHRRTDGLPLFLASVVDEVLAQGGPWPGAAVGGTDSLDGAVDAVPPRVPESLAGVIARRVVRLAPARRALLEAASVCGQSFGAGLLAEVLERDPDEVAGDCDALAQEGQWLAAPVLEPLPGGGLDARCTFRHALVRQVLYQRLGTMARARLHRRAAAALQRRREAGADVSSAELALHCALCHDVQAALRHYAEAAEGALHRFAPGEAMRLTGQALALLPSCPESPARDALELALLGPRGVAASQLLGVTADATRAVYERVEALFACGGLPAHTSRALELGLGWVCFVRGEYGKALAQAERLHELAARHGDPVLRVGACHLSGATRVYQGDLAGGRHWLEQGLQGAAGLGGTLADALAVVDLQVSLHARLSQALAHLGLMQQAEAQIAAARERAQRLGYPYGRRLVLIYEAFLAQRLEQPARVLEAAEALQRLGREHAIAQAEGPARWLRGWALAHTGQPLEGLTLILDGYERDTRLGMRRGRSGVLGHAAEAAWLAGRAEEARARLEEAFALAGQLGERLHLPELLLLRGGIALGAGDAASARSATQAAWHEACAQQAPWPALAAAVALCGLPDAGAQDVQALALARAQVVEGAGSALIGRADARLGG